MPTLTKVIAVISILGAAPAFAEQPNPHAAHQAANAAAEPKPAGGSQTMGCPMREAMSKSDATNAAQSMKAEHRMRCMQGAGQKAGAKVKPKSKG